MPPDLLEHLLIPKQSGQEVEESIGDQLYKTNPVDDWTSRGKGYLLTTWVRKITCQSFNWMLVIRVKVKEVRTNVAFTYALMTGTFNWNIGKLFSELKLDWLFNLLTTAGVKQPPCPLCLNLQHQQTYWNKSSICMLRHCYDTGCNPEHLCTAAANWEATGRQTLNIWLVPTIATGTLKYSCSDSLKHLFWDCQFILEHYPCKMILDSFF